jgi:hypothetical protein
MRDLFDHNLTQAETPTGDSASFEVFSNQSRTSNLKASQKSGVADGRLTEILSSGSENHPISVATRRKGGLVPARHTPCTGIRSLSKT